MKNINIVIPMAGLGSRFSKVGYSKPKPFIEINGKPMIEHVINNLNVFNANFILVGQSIHIAENSDVVNYLIKNYKVKFVEIDGLTEGTACTVLSAANFINNDDSLLIANSDQLIDIDVNLFINDSISRNLDGSILCFEDAEMNPKWSFVKLNDEGYVTMAKEKEAISNLATVGIYLFSKGKDFVESAIEMIVSRDKVNGEYYTCPSYNYLIKQKKKIGVYNLEFSQMHGLGTPEDLELYKRKFNFN